jgi:nucleotide-binding universal stress UspA family protein
MKQILVGTDMTQGSRSALERAVRLASRSGASLRIVHCPSPQAFAGDGLAIRQDLREQVQALIDALPGSRPYFSIRMANSAPERAILEEAEKVGADLIVLGAHDEPRFRDAIFGTTGTHVVRHSDRPILVVQGDPLPPYARVLVAIDDVEAASAILTTTQAIAPDAETFAVHAFSPSLGETLAGSAELDRQEARHALALEKLLGAAGAGRGAATLTAETHAVVETGEALSVIMETTKAIEPDLLVMGTRRRATYLSSHAVDTLFWCPHDILVVPEREGA